MRSACLGFLFAALAWPAAAARVAIDVGHFVEKPGATSARGRVEFEFNRDLAREIAAALARRHIEALLIGEAGETSRLSSRPRAARGAALLLSVHHDSVQPHFLETWTHEGADRLYSDRYAGFSLFVSHKNPRLKRSLACASSLGAALRDAGFTPSLYHAERIPGEMKPFADRVNGVHYFDNLVVLSHAAGAAVLLEAGVIVNRAEELRLADPATRSRMAEAVAQGIERCGVL